MLQTVVATARLLLVVIHSEATMVLAAGQLMASLVVPLTTLDLLRSKFPLAAGRLLALAPISVKLSSISSA
jgi:hypothetical protein